MKSSLLLIIGLFLIPQLWLYTLNGKSLESFIVSKEAHPWKKYIKQWLSFNLQKDSKSGFLKIQMDILILAKNIWTICFGKSPYTYCGGQIRGLCNALQKDINNFDICEWKLAVPNNSCMNITIMDLPSSNPFIEETFRFNIGTSF